MDVRNVKRTFRAVGLAGGRGAQGRTPRGDSSAMPPLVRLGLIAAAILVLGCRGAGPAPHDGAEEAAGDAPPAGERQVAEEQVPEPALPLDAEPSVDAEPGTDAETDVAEEPAVSRDQAVGVARRQVLFQPETELAELAADEEPPVWRVTLRGRRPGGSLFAFEEATVTVDARTGDVLGVEAR